MLLFAVKIAYKITQTIAKHRVKVPFIAAILSSLYHMQTLLFFAFSFDFLTKTMNIECHTIKSKKLLVRRIYIENQRRHTFYCKSCEKKNSNHSNKNCSCKVHNFLLHECKNNNAIVKNRHSQNHRLANLKFMNYAQTKSVYNVYLFPSHFLYAKYIKYIYSLGWCQQF